MADPILTFVSVAQRTDPTFLVDLDFTAAHPDVPAPSLPYGQAVYGVNTYGQGKFLDLVSAEFSVDGGDTWRLATPQAFDRLHDFDDAGKVGPVWIDPQPFTFVWDAFRDLLGDPEGDYQAILRISLSGSATVVLTSTSFSVSTIIPPLDEDRLTAGLEKRRLSERIDDFLGAGPIAPFRRGGSDFMTGRGRELVKSAIWQILNTRAATERWGGELPWEPGFGSLFWTLKHAPGDEITEELAHSYAEEALAWEPRVVVESVETEIFDKEAGGRGLRVRVGYSLIAENVPSNQVILPTVETVEVEVT